jgi:MFS family permease
MLTFILYKDLHATLLQITVMIILKPASALIALYWGAHVKQRQDRLRANLVWARVLSHIPFFFFPFVENPWYFIFCFGFYMMLARGQVPAWMEILKQNVPEGKREKLFAYVSSFGYLGGALIPIVLGLTMDEYPESWRWLFPVIALISIAGTFYKLRLPIRDETLVNPPKNNLKLHQAFIEPWKSAWSLLKARPDFAQYQIGFMLGGAGLIMMQPALPEFFMNDLHLSYTELGFAMALFRGIGFASTSPFWAKHLRRIDIYKFNSQVTFLAALFPMLLIMALYTQSFIYVAYLVYGMMQAGSEMSWHLSGPIFSKDEDSSFFSSINVLTVGVRGCIVPGLGSLLLYLLGPIRVLCIGGVFCLLSTVKMISCSRQRSELCKFNLDQTTS